MENDDFTLAKDLSVTSSSATRKEKGESSGKRSKSTHACDHCKKKKVKCNGEYPCARCQKSNVYCTFEQHKQKRTSSKLYVRTQEQRIHALEKALNSLYVEPTIQSFNHHTGLTNDTTNQSPMTPIEKFDTGSTGRPYYARDWTARLDRLPSTFDMMIFLDNEPKKPDAFALPDTSINLSLLSTYFDHVQPYFPLIHKESFLLTVHEQSPLLLNAMYAVADQWAHIDLLNSGTDSPFRSTQVPPQTHPGLKYYQDAISLVELYADAPRLSTIQALLLIVKYHELVRRPGFFYRTRFYFDLVVRMCNDLGLSRILPPTCQVHPILAEQRRRIFWIAYIYDLLISTELGTPAMFLTDECTVELPSLLEDERNFREQHDTILYFHWMTMVMKAQGTVVHYLRQKYHSEPNGRQKNVSNHLYSLQQHMEGLGRELQLWKKPARGRVNFLFLAYHFTNTLLYRSMALDLMNNDVYIYQQTGLGQDYIKAFLLNEANAIADIVEMLLKDHTVACLHYSFRGIQQVIHYLTAARTIQLMYRQTDNNDRVRRMIQQLIPLAPAVELYSMERQQSLHTPLSHIPTYARHENTNDPFISAGTIEHLVNEDKKQKLSVKLQQQQQLRAHSPSSSSSPPTSISSPSSSPSPSQSHSSSHTGVHQKALTANGSETTQFLNGTPFINTASSNSLWQQQQQQQQKKWLHQTMDNQYVSPSQLSSSLTPTSTSDLVSTIHTHADNNCHPPPVLNTTTLALLHQSSTVPSSSEPMIPTPSLGSLSSTSSLSTIATTPVDTVSSTHGSLRLRRSHQQLRNTPYRLLPTDTGSKGSASLHYPYIPTDTANAPTTLQQQNAPRRHTVSSGQSSPSTLSLPSSPLHRMTLADDPWIQAPSVFIPSKKHHYQQHSTTPPPPVPPFSSSSSPNLLVQEKHEALSDLPPSTIHQYATEQQGHGDLENEIYSIPFMDDSLLFKGPAEEESMMGLLRPTHLDWDQQVTSTPASPRSSSPLPPI